MVCIFYFHIFLTSEKEKAELQLSTHVPVVQINMGCVVLAHVRNTARTIRIKDESSDRAASIVVVQKEVNFLDQ